MTMTALGGDDKPSLDELAHHGVLGMKWGHRKKATASQIRVARRNLNNQRNDIHNQVDKVYDTTKRGTAERAKGVKKLQDMNTAYLKNPDRVIAARMTRGEKAVALILAGTGVAAPAALGAIAGSSAVSRRIEKKQDDGAYDKKK